MIIYGDMITDSWELNVALMIIYDMYLANVEKHTFYTNFFIACIKVSNTDHPDEPQLHQ